jgi:DNA-binding MarR family transcriptional regulator
VQATTSVEQELGGDLYALVVYLHKRCTPELFEAIGALDLSLTQIKLLGHLDEADRALTLKEAGERVGVSLPAASRVVDDLVRRGLLERHEDLDDRRMKRVSITADGRAVIGRLNAARLHGLQQFAQSLSDDERRHLAGALAHILQRDDVKACRPETETE